MTKVINKKNQSLKNFKQEALEKYFQQQDSRAYTGLNLFRIFEKEKRSWGLKKNFSAEKILEYCLQQGIFEQHKYLNNRDEIKTIFSYHTKDFLTIISALKPDSYFSYLTAMHFHGLAPINKNTFYLNSEKSTYENPRQDNPLTQQKIDEAFYYDPKQSTNTNTFKRKAIIVTNGKRTDRLGVISTVNSEQHYSYTDLERTLIDIVIRPIYAQDVSQVLKAFKKARQKINLDKLKSYLEKLNYLYPYDQAIGFYLTRAGYKKRESRIFKRESIFDFYLIHGEQDLEYNAEWKIYYPAELDE